MGMSRLLAGGRAHGACNSLIDDFIPATVAGLREDGSLQELGKRAAWSAPRMVSSSVARLSTVDLATDGTDVAWYSSLMHLLSARLSCGAATGLPLTSYELQKVHAAFNFLRSGSNIGKVVVCSALTSVVDMELRHDVRPAVAQVLSLIHI